MFTDTKSALLYVLFCAVIPYLLGSISFSIIVSRLLFRKDVRNYGSHNAGMTNVLRTFGKGAAALTLAGDIGKGVAAVLLAKWFFSAHLNDAIYYRGAIIGVYLAAFFAVIGHVYPLYFGFKGGKAVSVATGTIIALEPVLLVPLVRQEFNIVALTAAPPTKAEIDEICSEVAKEFSLSGREAEILVLIARGYTTNNMAEKLVISPYTVNTHVRHIYEKMQIHKRSELLNYLNMQRSDF